VDIRTYAAALVAGNFMFSALMRGAELFFITPESLSRVGFQGNT
jgi:hypothetical protein